MISEEGRKGVKVELETYSNVRYVPRGITRACTNTKSDTVAIIRSDNSVEFLAPIPGSTASFYMQSRGYVLPVENSIESAVLLDDGTLLGGCLDGSLFFLRPGDTTPLTTIVSLGGGSVWGMSKLEDTIALACEDGSMHICQLKNHEVILKKTSTRHATRLLSCAISPNGHFIACGSADGQVRIYKVSSGSCLKQLKVPHPNSSSEGISVWCVNWVQTVDDLWITAGDSLGQTTIWNSSFELANAICFKAHLADVLAIASHDGILYSSGIDNRTAQFVLVDNANGSKSWTKAFSRRIASHDVKSMVIYRDKYLLTGSADGVLRISNLKSIQNREQDRFHSALPSSCIFHRNGDIISVSIENGKLLLLNDVYEAFACVKLISNEPIVDHAVCDKIIAIATPTSTKFFEFSPTRISKIISFENLTLTTLSSSKSNAMAFRGVSVDETGKVDLYEFLVTGDDESYSVQKTKASSGISLAEGIFVKAAILEKDLILTSNSQLIDLKTNQTITLPCSPQCATYIEDKNALAIGLVNGQLLLIDRNSANGSQQKIIKLSTDSKWTSRPIISLVNCPSHNRLLVFNENMIISLDTNTNFIQVVQDVSQRNILHVSIHNNGTKLRVLSRPWEQVVEDLPPVFAAPKYGLN